MWSPNLLVTVDYEEKRYRGAYYVRGDLFIVEASGLGRKTADAAILNSEVDESAERLAKLMLTELVREGLNDPTLELELAMQGSITQTCF